MTDMTVQEACNATKQFARFLKGMERLQEVASVLENSDSVVRENQAALSALVAKQEAADKQLVAANASLAETQGQVEAARTQAAQIVADAKEAAKTVAGAAAKKVAAAESAAAAALEKQVAAEKAAADALAEERETLSRIDAAKAAARATFG